MNDFGITMYQGDSYVFVFTITQSSGTVMDLTSSTIYFTGKRNIDDADSAAIFDILCNLTDPTNGVCKATLTTSNTDYVGDIYLELEYRIGTTVKTLKQWKGKFNPDIRNGA